MWITSNTLSRRLVFQHHKTPTAGLGRLADATYLWGCGIGFGPGLRNSDRFLIRAGDWNIDYFSAASGFDGTHALHLDFYGGGLCDEAQKPRLVDLDPTCDGIIFAPDKG